MAGLSQRLISLVQADPVLMLYALEHLGKNVPLNMDKNFFPQIIHNTAQNIYFKLLNLLTGKDPSHRLTPDQIARLEIIWGQLADETAIWTRMAHTFRDADVAAIRTRLRQTDPIVRKVAVQIIAQRRLPLEDDLIDQLRDPLVSSLAHDALVRLARGTDFGPPSGASKRGIERSIEKWKQWLALQQRASQEMLAKGAAGERGKAASLEMVPLVLVHDDRPALSTDAGKMSEELLNAKVDEQMSVLARLRDAKGIDNTDALALAIPKLSGNIKRQARDALTERMTRMTAATLRDKLQDDSVEVRCAAAVACGRKKANEAIPDLLQLLDDPEMDVIQTARAVLTTLSGEDFGPKSDAGRRSCAEAAAAWRKWWREKNGGGSVPTDSSPQK